MRTLFLSIALIAALVACQPSSRAYSTAVTGSVKPEADTATAARVGDRWIYEVRDGLAGDLRTVITYVVSQVTPRDITTRLTMRGGYGSAMVVYDHAWDRIEDPRWKFSPNDGSGIVTPLEVGKEWSFRRDGQNTQTGRRTPIRGHTAIIAAEDITTKAGTFHTYRMETTMEERGGKATVDTWYAPAVNHWVRRVTELRSDDRVRDKYSEELIEYTRRPTGSDGGPTPEFN